MCIVLIVYMIVHLVIVILNACGVSLTYYIERFIREQGFWVLAGSGLLIYGFLFFFIKGLIYDVRGEERTGFAYCYGHRQEGEAYYKKGTLFFEDDRVSFIPFDKGAKSFLIPYDKIIRSEIVLDKKSLLQEFFCQSFFLSELYRVNIRYRDDKDRERILEFGLPHFTRLMAVVRQKLYKETAGANL